MGLRVAQDYDQKMLEVGYEDSSERLLLWLPVICKHVITEASPLANWLKPSGIMADADSSIVVVIEGYQYCNAQNRMRMRVFNVLDDVKREAGFAPVVTRPADSPDFKPRVNWSRCGARACLHTSASISPAPACLLGLL